ncbi:hypothetical protein Pfo_003779 [Paulownia fortunei]|nr:hypothetical protein Pfo_003779 [Paulownia fortunei]
MKIFVEKLIIFCRDFRQVLSIVLNATIYQTISTSLVKSYLCEFLLKVRNSDESSDTTCNIKFSKEMIIEYDNKKNSILRLIRVIFTVLNKNHINKLNNKLIFTFSRKARTFNSFSKTVNDINNYYKDDILNSLTLNGLHPHKLVLEKKCPIIILRNFDQSNGLYNGIRMHIFIIRVPLLRTENESYSFQIRYKQFHIKLCFVMTIRNAQNQTISNVNVYLSHSMFSHNQLYIALLKRNSISIIKVLIKPNTSNVGKKM